MNYIYIYIYRTFAIASDFYKRSRSKYGNSLFLLKNDEKNWKKVFNLKKLRKIN
jgi:hypothetical protein